MDDKQRDYINAIDAFYTNWERSTSLELQDFIHTPNFILIDKKSKYVVFMMVQMKRI